MSDGTKIAWTEATWNPIRARRRDGQPNKAGGGWACQRVSPGCVNCYAAGINKRLGTGLDYDARGVAASDIYLDERILTQPLHWRKPRRIFVCSMTDLFGEWVPDEWIDRVFAVMALASQHTFQVLTKRPDAMRGYFDDPDVISNVEAAADEIAGEKGWCHSGDWSWPLPNVWLGVSAENQRVADERIPELLNTPAAVRWLSCEPLLGPVDLASHKAIEADGTFTGWRIPHGIDWVVVGGESGTGARACHVGWIRSIVRQGQVARVPVFVKQVGANSQDDLVEGTDWRRVYRDRAGGDPAEWAADLRVREFPEARDE